MTNSHPSNRPRNTILPSIQSVTHLTPHTPSVPVPPHPNTLTPTPSPSLNSHPRHPHYRPNSNHLPINSIPQTPTAPKRHPAPTPTPATLPTHTHTHIHLQHCAPHSPHTPPPITLPNQLYQDLRQTTSPTSHPSKTQHNPIYPITLTPTYHTTNHPPKEGKTKHNNQTISSLPHHHTTTQPYSSNTKLHAKKTP